MSGVLVEVPALPFFVLAFCNVGEMMCSCGWVVSEDSSAAIICLVVGMVDVQNSEPARRIHEESM
jgi:hypothetical protein